MKIYHHMHLLSKIKRFYLYRDNTILGRLIGINIETGADDSLHVYPVHKPLLAFKRGRGQLIIEIPLRRRHLLMSFSGRGIEVCLVPELYSDVGKEDH